MRISRVIVLIASAILRVWASLSITHGPAIRKSSPEPTWTLPTSNSIQRRVTDPRANTPVTKAAFGGHEASNILYSYSRAPGFLLSAHFLWPQEKLLFRLRSLFPLL